MSKIGNLLKGAVIGTVAGVAVNAAGGLLNALFMSRRSIGGIIPDVTIEEHHSDTLTITDHPVEQGAAITDHAFKNPAEVTMYIAWSNASLLLSSVVSGSLFAGKLDDVNDLYGKMLDLQESRVPFDLVTGKRTYSNMLIKHISNTTDKDTENCLMLSVHMRQIIIVETTAVLLAPTENQALPAETGPVENNGTKQPVVAKTQSALSVLFGD